MPGFLNDIQNLIRLGKVRISDHGYDEMADDGIRVDDVISGIADAKVVEEYPDYPEGPCILVLQSDAVHDPMHVLWGVPAGHSEPAVLVTAYRPDPARWTVDFLRRRP